MSRIGRPTNRKKGFGGPNNRDPLLDTGIPGVVVSRTWKRGRKRVVVSAAFRLKKTIGTPEPTMRYTGSVSDQTLELNAELAQKRFDEARRKAMAIRRYAETFYERDTYPTTRLPISEVPQAIIDATPEPPRMDLAAIMNSFESPPPKKDQPLPKDRAARVVALQAFSLGQPQRATALNGHTLRFHALFVNGTRVYVPEQMGRGRDHWWLTVPAEDGAILDEVYDSECGDDAEASLREAWVYLISLMREHPAPTQ